MSSAPSSRTWLAPAFAAVLTALVGFVVFPQGFDFARAGIWLHGAARLAATGRLYAEVAVDDGPGRFLLLLPFTWLVGKSALAIPLLHVVTTALVAGLGFASTRPRAGLLAWLVPVGVIALGPIDPAATLVFALTLALVHLGRGRGLLVGALLGFGAWFDLATLWLCLTLVVVNWVARPQARAQTRTTVATAVAVTATLVVGLAVRGELSGWVTHVFVSSTTHWRAVGLDILPRWLGETLRGEGFAAVFAGVMTGEAWPRPWPAADTLKTISVLGQWVSIALIGAWAWRRRSHPGDGPLAVAATCALACLLLGGAQTARASALLVGLCLWPRWLGSTTRARGFVALALALWLYGPGAAEKIWLVAQAERPTTARWERPTARVDLEASRPATLENVFATMDLAPDDPVLIWPNRPGLYPIMNLRAPTRYAWLAEHHTVDTDAMLAQLDANSPPYVALALDTTFASQMLRRQWPDAWWYLRQNYSVVGNLVKPVDRFRVLRRLPRPLDANSTLPLTQRLADVEVLIGTEVGPAMRPGLAMGQSLVVATSDLAGFSVRWQNKGKPITVRARVRIWQRRTDEFDALLDFHDLVLDVPTDGHRSYIRFEEPIANTVGKDIAVVIELEEDPPSELRLWWHRYDAEERRVDFFPEGSAIINRKPVRADLYFATY